MEKSNRRKEKRMHIGIKSNTGDLELTKSWFFCTTCQETVMAQLYGTLLKQGTKLVCLKCETHYKINYERIKRKVKHIDR